MSCSESSAEKLIRMQALPLKGKILIAKNRISEFYSKYNGQVYISFSGGKDSVVLLDLVRSMYPKVPAVFFDTGLEFPEIRKFVKTFDNVKWIRPKMTYYDVIEKYGYPVVSKDTAQKIQEIRTTNSDYLRNKRLYGDKNGNGKVPEKWKYLIDAPFKVSSYCCNVMKKSPAKKYEKTSGRHPFVGTMASDSSTRKSSWIRHGCNAFDTKRPMSTPMGIWKKEDVWEYIETFDVRYCEIYDMGYNNTGCMFCAFGAHLEHPNKFHFLKKTHPRQYKYCMKDLGLEKVLDYMGVERE